MATIEAGVFIFLCALGFAGILLVNRLGFFTIFSAVVFIALALMMFSGYDIVTTKQVDAYETVQTQYNSSGGLLYNTTISTPQHTEQTSVIDSQQMTIGYIMSALAILSLVVFGKQVVFG